MKYLSLSIITTGVVPAQNDILEIGCIVEDTHNKLPYDEIPKLRFWVDKEFYRGNPLFLVKHNDILEKIVELREARSARLVLPDRVFGKLSPFIRSHFSVDFTVPPITLVTRNYAGKVLPFLRRLKDFDTVSFHNEVIDPSQFYINFNKDSRPLTVSECIERNSHLKFNEGTNTLREAWENIILLRERY